MFSQFGRTFWSKYSVCSTVPHRSSLFYLWINYMARLPSDAISREARGSRSRLHSRSRLYSRSRVSSVLLREPSYYAYVYVPTNELGDPRFEPGNWNVRIKLAAHPSVAVRLYRSPSYPCLSFSLMLPFATAIPFARNRDKRFWTKSLIGLSTVL